MSTMWRLHSSEEEGLGQNHGREKLDQHFEGWIPYSKRIVIMEGEPGLEKKSGMVFTKGAEAHYSISFGRSNCPKKGNFKHTKSWVSSRG